MLSVPGLAWERVALIVNPVSYTLPEVPVFTVQFETGACVVDEDVVELPPVAYCVTRNESVVVPLECVNVHVAVLVLLVPLSATKKSQVSVSLPLESCAFEIVIQFPLSSPDLVHA